MLNKDKTDNEAVFAAENAMAGVFSSKYGIDAAPGSATRELAIRPAAVLRSMEEDWRTALTTSLNLFSIADGSVEGQDDLVDAIASIYRIKRRGGAVSAGTMMVEVAEVPTVYINSGMSFSINNVRLEVPGVYVGHSGSLPEGSADGVHHVMIRRYAKGVDLDGSVIYSFCMLVPVYCESGDSFPAGIPIAMNGPSGGIIECSVFSAITGGGNEESNQDLARRVLEGLPPGVMSTPLQIKNTLSEEFGIPPHRTKVLGASDCTSRSCDIITGLPVPGTVDICAAPTGDCPVETVETTPMLFSGTTWMINLDENAAAGMYEVTSLVVNGNAVSEYTVEWMPSEVGFHQIKWNNGYRFSAFQTATVTFDSDDDLSNATALLTIRRQPLVPVIQSFVDGTDKRAPGQDTVVYSPFPVFLRMSLAVSGGNASDETLRTTLCNYLNNLPVGRGYVDGQDCFDALNAIGVKVVFPITMYAHILTDGVSYDIMSSNGRLEYGSITKGRDVVYVSANDVRMTAG